MATAEHLLHEAQYAYSNISFGDSRDNRRHAARARSLSKKIIRKFPASKEASEAHAILRRLGDEAYSSAIKARHTHISQAEHHQPPSSAGQFQRPSSKGQSPTPLIEHGDLEAFNWRQLFSWLFNLPKAVLSIIAIGGFFLLSIFGPFLIIILFAFVLLTGPFRKTLKPKQRREMNTFVARANQYIAQQQNSKS
jgi:hypothetical protein